MLNVLFLCGRNQWRSPTAEQLFSEHPGVDCRSAGLSPDAEQVLEPELLEWAELVFVMEREHKRKLQSRFAALLRGKRVVCLDIPDRYRFMDPALIKLLQAKVTRHLPAG